MAAASSPASCSRPVFSMLSARPPGGYAIFAQERYYLYVFGSQTAPFHPGKTHVWATVVKVGWPSPSEDRLSVRLLTVSWMPATLKVDILKPFPEPGVNLNLQSTLGYALATNQRITYWGPFEIEPEMAHRFAVQKKRLESGIVRYQAIDSLLGHKTVPSATAFMRFPTRIVKTADATTQNWSALAKLRAKTLLYL